MTSSRRSLIKHSTVLGVALYFKPSLIFGKYKIIQKIPPIATEVELAITIAQFALGAGKMFNGNSSSGVEAIQIQMFKVISDQLKIIQSGITTILENVEAVRKIMLSLPQEVVKAINENNVLGCIQRYDVLMDTYKEFNKNTTQFLNKNDNRQKVKDLRDDLRKAASQIIPFNSYFNIPLLASTMYMEHNCMVLLDESNNNIRPIIRSYRDFFSAVLINNPTNLIDTISEMKMSKKQALLRIEKGRMYWGTITPSAAVFEVGTVDFSVENDFTSHKKETDELVALGLIGNTDRLIKIKTIYNKRNLMEARAIWEPAETYFNPFYNPGLPKPTLAETQSNLNTEASDLQADYNLKTLQLYTASSCYYAGNRALNFCNQF